MAGVWHSFCWVRWICSIDLRENELYDVTKKSLVVRQICRAPSISISLSHGVQFRENYFLSLKRLCDLCVGTINTAISEDTDFYAAVSG